MHQTQAFHLFVQSWHISQTIISMSSARNLKLVKPAFVLSKNTVKTELIQMESNKVDLKIIPQNLNQLKGNLLPTIS